MRPTAASARASSSSTSTGVSPRAARRALRASSIWRISSSRSARAAGGRRRRAVVDRQPAAPDLVVEPPARDQRGDRAPRSPTATTTNITIANASCIHHDCPHVAAPATQDLRSAPPVLYPDQWPLALATALILVSVHRVCVALDGLWPIRGYPGPLTDQSIVMPSREQRWSISR